MRLRDMRMRNSGLAAAVLLPLLGIAVRASAQAVRLRAGMRITGTVAVRPGLYHLRDYGDGTVQVSGRNYTLDLRGVHVAGPGGSAGTGIVVSDASGITLRGISVVGMRWGIVLRRCKNVRLVDCSAPLNGTLPPGTVIDESGRHPEDDHGGGILLQDCTGCTIERSTATHEWDGIDVVRSDRNLVEKSDFSYNGNWGVHFWASSYNKFCDNRAVWCTTGGGLLHQPLTGWQTYDSQAVAIDHASTANRIESNDLRFGGDGIYIRANEDPANPGTVLPKRSASNANVLIGNDCSFSPNNAIEADFVEDTVIRGNNCSCSNYGMWLGYSQRCRVEGNLCINDSRRAVEIENGRDDLFAGNVFGFDTPRKGAALVYLRQNGRDDTPSRGYVIRHNVFYGADRPVRLRNTGVTADDNAVIAPAPTGDYVQQEGACQVQATATAFHAAGARSVPAPPRITHLPELIPAGGAADLVGADLYADGVPAVVEMDGIPLAPAAPTAGSHDRLRLRMPPDFWDRPAPRYANVKVFNGSAWTNARRTRIRWPDGDLRVTRVLWTGAVDRCTVSWDRSLTTAPLRQRTEAKPPRVHAQPLPPVRVLIDGMEASLTSVQPGSAVCSPPPRLKAGTPANLVVERGTGDRLRWSWPVVVNLSGEH